MHVACLCPLPIGVLRWHAPQPTTTVIVKATFSLDGEGLRDVQQGLDRDDAGAIGTEEELERASDFAPRKPRADVLLVGQAHTAKPRREWLAVLEVDGWSKRFVAVTEEPSPSVPLLSTFLRSDETGKPVRVGPLPQDVPGWRSRRVSAEFDFARFNVAPGDQRLARLTPRCRITLTGLLGDGTQRSIELPGLHPSVYHVTSRDRGAPAHPVPLTCDTLWIHTDAGVCTLTWRGEIAQPGPTSFLVLDAAYGIPPGWSAMAARIGDAVWIKAVEDREIAPPLPRSEEVTLAEGVPSSGPTRVWGNEPSTDELEDPDHESTPMHRLEGMVLGSSALGSAERERRPTRDTMKSEEVARGPALPFRKPEGHALPPDIASRIENYASSSPRETRAIEGDEALGPVLPFAQVAQADVHETMDEVTGPSSPMEALRAALPFSPPPVRQQPLGPAPRISEPPVRYQPETATSPPAMEPEIAAAPQQERWDSGCMPLDLYAEIKVEILSGKRSLNQILDTHSIDEVRWREEERKRAEALSRAAKGGDGSAVLDLRRAMRAAMRRIEQR